MKRRPSSPAISIAPKRRLGRKEAFSLVEVLVVLSIMSILAVLTMTSVEALRSTSLTSSGNQMAAAFSMARQNAISRQSYTAIVIKSQGAKAYNAYCVLELKRGDDGSFGEWQAVTPWRFLGQGVIFESGQSSDTFTSTAVGLPQPLPTSFAFQGQPIDLTASAVYQCYQPDGTLLGGQNPPLRLRLIEGAVNPSSGAVTYQGATVSGQPVSIYDLVFVSNTGVTKIERP